MHKVSSVIHLRISLNTIEKSVIHCTRIAVVELTPLTLYTWGSFCTSRKFWYLFLSDTLVTYLHTLENNIVVVSERDVIIKQSCCHFRNAYTRIYKLGWCFNNRRSAMSIQTWLFRKILLFLQALIIIKLNTPTIRLREQLLARIWFAYFHIKSMYIITFWYLDITLANILPCFKSASASIALDS